MTKLSITEAVISGILLLVFILCVRGCLRDEKVEQCTQQCKGEIACIQACGQAIPHEPKWLP